MSEELLVTARSNALIDPSLHIWTWEVAMYLFMGGLTAGIMIFAALMTVRDKDQVAPFATHAPGTSCANRIVAGHDNLVPRSGAQAFRVPVLHVVPDYVPDVMGRLDPDRCLPDIGPADTVDATQRVFVSGVVCRQADSRTTDGRLVRAIPKEIAFAVIPFAVALGIYTGILLSAFGARPFWNSGVLGLLFLVSGMSTAAALVVLLARQKSEKELFTRIDLVLIFAEIALVALSLISLASGSGQHIDALQSVMGGSYTFVSGYCSSASAC